MEQTNSQANLQDSNKALWISGAVIFLLVLGLFTNGFGLFNKNNNKTENPGEFIALSIDNSPVLGETSAPVTIYEFSDFSCPYCASAAGYNEPGIEALKADDSTWSSPIKGIKERYVKEGKVKLVFKYFPGHGTGIVAHSVAWCLKDQNLFWEFHDKAFEQFTITSDIEKMKEIASDLGANSTQLEKCLTEGKYDLMFKQDKAMGTSNGVKGTPTFFIGGKSYSGAISFDVLKSAVDSALKKAGQ